MKRINIIFNNILQSNKLTGFLGLIIIILLFFIIWSLIAIFSFLPNSLGWLNFSFFPYFSSNNLVISLLRDIARPYFSLFTLISLFFIIYILRLGYKTVSDFYYEIMNANYAITENKILEIIRFKNKEFSRHQSPNKTGEKNRFESYFFAHGAPLIVSIKPLFALSINIKGAQKIFVNSNLKEEIQVTLNRQDSVIDLYSLEPVSFRVSLLNTTNIFQAPYLEFTLGYAYKLPVSLKTDAQSPLMNLFNLCESNMIRAIIDKIIICELKTTLTHFSKDPLKSIESQSPLSYIENSKPEFAVNKLDSSKKNNRFSIYSVINFGRHIFKRNRRRSMLPFHISPLINNSLLNENESNSLKNESLNVLFIQNFQRSIEKLFGLKIIEARIIAIGEKNIK